MSNPANAAIVGVACSFMMITLADTLDAQGFRSGNECSSQLSLPPLSQLGEYSKRGDFSLFMEDGLAFNLIGRYCSGDTLKKYFVSNGWEFVAESNQHMTLRFGAFDRQITFCYPNNYFSRLIIGRCRQVAGIFSLDDHIVWIYSHGGK